MEAKAEMRFLRVTAQKARRVVDLVRGRSAVDAIALLKFQPQEVAGDVLKLIQSAVANARVLAEISGERFVESELIIKEIFVDEGQTMKRIRPRAQGRAAQILKRTCHISVIVATPEAAVKKGAL